MRESRLDVPKSQVYALGIRRCPGRLFVISFTHEPSGNSAEQKCPRLKMKKKML